jgi:Carboxypeptidase regulatory-like domain
VTRTILAALMGVVLIGGGPAAAQAQPSGSVTGVVLDQTGAILPGASVDLLAPSGVVVQTTKADQSGTFRFEPVAPGAYDLRATYEGFAPASVRVRVAARPLAPQKLMLKIAGLTQEITVTNSAAQVDATAGHNLDAVSVDQSLLESLPVFDQDYIATLSRFLDAGSLGTGGVTLVVNGMEVSALRVSASAVQQIKINQDPYSAEYSRPGRGRIEILTKPGGQSVRGEANLIARDARYDARNAFATTDPDERKHIAEGTLGGPVGGGGKTSFLLSARDQMDDQQAVVFASGPSGVIRATSSQPNREALVSASVTHQHSNATTVSIRPSLQYESNRNRGVGGETLPTAGTDFTHNEQQVTYTQQTIVRPTLVNQFQLLVGHEREPTTSVADLRKIVVAGAFTGGGAQEELVRTERHINLTESLAWTHGAHLIQGGFQLPDWSRRGFFDRTNAGGTFFFSGLDAYAAGLPYAFTQQQGNGDVVFLEKQVGAYLKDDWQVRPGLSTSLGVRFDWQNYFHDNNNMAPRASLAFAPGNRKTDVIRAGVGVFNDRSGPVVIADVLHSRPGGLVRYVISSPTYPDPFQSSAAAVAPPSVVRLAPGVQIPQTLQYSVGLDHQLRKTTAVSVTYTGSRGRHLFRSRDVNAPAPPLYTARPDPAYGVIREIESNGRQASESLQISIRGRMTKWFNGQTQYTFSRLNNDTSGINAFPANDYDLSGEWSRGDGDRHHRLIVLGRVSAGSLVDFGVGVTMNSAGPYTEVLGPDIYNNGRGRARPPGVTRNNLEAAGFAALDLRASREIKLGRGGNGARALTVALDGFNILNRVNYGSFVGTVGSPLFGLPVSARPPRQLQLSGRVKF